MQRAALLSEYLYEFASGMHRATRQKATRARHSFTFLPPSLSLSLFFSFSFSRVLSLPARFLLGRISSAFIILCVSNSNFLFPPLFRSRSSLARPRAIHYSYQRRDRGSRVRSASDFGTAPVGSRACARAHEGLPLRGEILPRRLARRVCDEACGFSGTRGISSGATRSRGIAEQQRITTRA